MQHAYIGLRKELILWDSIIIVMTADRVIPAIAVTVTMNLAREAPMVLETPLLLDLALVNVVEDHATRFVPIHPEEISLIPLVFTNFFSK